MTNLALVFVVTPTPLLISKMNASKSMRRVFSKTAKFTSILKNASSVLLDSKLKKGLVSKSRIKFQTAKIILQMKHSVSLVHQVTFFPKIS